MNEINRKTISINLLKFALPLFVILFIQIAANAQTFQLGGTWTMYNDKNEKFDKPATITQSGANLSIDNGYGSNSTAVLNENTFTTSDGLTGTISTDGTRITWSNKFVWTLRGAFQTANDLSGNWKMYGKDGLPYEKNAVITQNGTSVTLDNGYGSVETVSFLDSKLMVRSWRLTGTVSADGNRIDWSNGIYWTKNSTPTTAGSGMITRTITLKNNSGFRIAGYLYRLNSSNVSSIAAHTTGSIDNSNSLALGVSQTIGSEVKIPSDDLVELRIYLFGDSVFGVDGAPIFQAILPRNKDYTTFCYEATGTFFDPGVKACDGSPTYESKYISFKNEAGFDSKMSLTYFPLGKTATSITTTETTRVGYQRKLYLPLDADIDKPMTLKISKEGFSNPVLSREVSLSDFETICYKIWGSFLTPKVSPCSLNPAARKIKLWNNSGYGASLSVTYYDKDQSGKDVAKTVKTNIIEVTQTETIEVPNGTSSTPIKINFINHFKSGTPFTTMTATADFTGELCYKVEGTAFAPTAATCDDTVGDTSGETRQIRFQNDAGYDAQMMVSFFVDEVINGNKIPMAKLLSTGMINGLGGKFRLVTIPKNTSKGMPITITIQGNATLKNAIFSTTLPEDFAASPQPCFKVWGTLFDPQGGKCNQ
jgi:hypothetical protein